LVSILFEKSFRDHSFEAGVISRGVVNKYD
jgi:hypothetical protein